jgi:hypothetical protein
MKYFDQVFLGVRVTEEAFLAESYQGLVHDLLDPEATQPSGVSAIEEPSTEDRQAEFEALSSEVKALVADVNRSVGAAQDATDVATRDREIATAREKITTLRGLAERHPSVQLERLDEVMTLIGRIESASD